MTMTAMAVGNEERALGQIEDLLHYEDTYVYSHVLLINPCGTRKPRAEISHATRAQRGGIYEKHVFKISISTFDKVVTYYIDIMILPCELTRTNRCKIKI